MNKKFFFFDYDGTLAHFNGAVPSDTYETIQKLIQAGHFVAGATGRLQLDAARLYRKAGITNFIADGGYSVTLNGEILYMKSLPLENTHTFLHSLNEACIPWSVVLKNELIRYSPHTKYYDYVGTNAYYRTIIDPDLYIENISEVYKVFLPLEMMECIDTTSYDLPMVLSNYESAFVEPVYKAEGIQSLLNHLNVPDEDVFVFGDGLNDLTMFCPQWTCIAMGNGEPTLKEKADFITKKNTDNGITYALQHFEIL